MKFFGNVAHLYPKEVCGRFQDFVGLLFRLLHHPDISLVSLAMETLGVIGNTIEGKQALEKLGKGAPRFVTARLKRGQARNID